MQITREVFINAVEAGIAAAEVTENEAAKLRDHAQTATQTCVGSFIDGCPLNAAGILPLFTSLPRHDEHARAELRREYDRLMPFASAFDDAVEDAVGVCSKVEVER